MTKNNDTKRIHQDAKPQFVRSRKGADNSGVMRGPCAIRMAGFGLRTINAV